MGKTNAKGEIGEAMILADLQRQGHGIAIPFGHDLPFDLIVVRKEDGASGEGPVQIHDLEWAGDLRQSDQYVSVGASSIHQR